MARRLGCFVQMLQEEYLSESSLTSPLCKFYCLGPKVLDVYPHTCVIHMTPRRPLLTTPCVFLFSSLAHTFSGHRGVKSHTETVRDVRSWTTRGERAAAEREREMPRHASSPLLHQQYRIDYLVYSNPTRLPSVSTQQQQPITRQQPITTSTHNTLLVSML